VKAAIERSSNFVLGTNDSGAPDEIREQEVSRLINGRVSLQGGSIIRRGGTWSPNDAAVDAGFVSNLPVGAIEWELASGAKQIVVLNRFNRRLLYSDDGGVTWAIGGAMGSGSTVKDKRWSFAVVREGSQNTLCMAGGFTTSYQWDGSTLSAISGIPSGVRFLATHGNRLIAAGHAGPAVVASKVADVDDWSIASGGWTVQATTHDGDEEITGLFKLGSVIMVFKRESVGYIEGFGYTTLQVETGAQGISRSVGCIAHRSIAPLGDSGVMWLSERGFESYYIGGQVTLESRNMQSFVDSILMAEIVETGFSVPSAIWLPQEREYWCAVPVGSLYVGELQDASFGRTSNTYIFCFRPPTKDSPKAMWAFTFGENPGSVFSGNDGTPFSLTRDADGILCLVEDTTGQQVTVGRGGALRLIERNEYGLDVHLANDGTLGIGLGGFTNTGEFDGGLLPCSLVTVDFAGNLSRPAMFTTQGWFYYLDDHDVPDDGRRADGVLDVRDIRMVTRLRPLMFGARFNRKRVTRVTVQSAQITAATVAIRVFGDGAAGVEKAITLPASTRGRAMQGDCRPSARGRVIDIELTTSDPIDLHAIEALATVYRERM
jgi:hypothetical protein